MERTLLALPCSVKGKGWTAALLFTVLLLGTGACASGPTLRPDTPTGTGPIVQEIPGLRISVEADAWRGGPKALPDYVLPLLVILKNTGTDPVKISRTDFVLLDETNRQYLPLAPTEVVTILGGRAPGTVVSPSVGVAGSTGGSTVFGVGLEVFLGGVGGYGSETRDIIPQALGEGPIQPGAEIHGFLYFARPAPDFKSLRLVAALRDLPGQPRLEFPFRRPGQ